MNSLIREYLKYVQLLMQDGHRPVMVIVDQVEDSSQATVRVVLQHAADRKQTWSPPSSIKPYRPLKSQISSAIELGQILSIPVFLDTKKIVRERQRQQLA